MNPQPIPSSSQDLERRRLESTLEADLHSLSISSLLTTTSSSSQAYNGAQTSLSTISSIEHPRGFGEGLTGRSDYDLDRLHDVHQSHNVRNVHDVHNVHNVHNVPDIHHFGPSGTPRAASRERNRDRDRAVSGAQSEKSAAQSPNSTAGHHVSQMTLGVGVFERQGGEAGNRSEGDDDDWDPERSLGRLVGELGRVMGDKISQRPTSPFSPSRSPRSPSPLSSLMTNQPNLSLTLNRNDPLLSPPSSGASDTTARKPSSGFSSMAQRLSDELRASKSHAPRPQPRRALSETTAHNMKTPGPKRAPQKDRLKNLQREERRTSSAPAGRAGGALADVTSLTNLLETPAKGLEHGSLGKNVEVAGQSGGNIPQTLATLHARLRALETENSLSRRRVRELEGEVEKARNEVEEARNLGDRRLRDVIGEKTALEDLVASLRTNLARITSELEHNKALVAELRAAETHARAPISPPHSRTVTSELHELRKQVERLGDEVQRLGGIVEEGLETRRRARGERTIRLEAEEMAQLANELVSDEDIDRVRRDVQRRSERPSSPQPAPSRLRQGLHAAATELPVLVPPTEQIHRVAPAAPRQNPTPPASEDGGSSPTPASRSSSSRQRSKSSRRVSERIEGPASPFPSIRAEDEQSFFSAAGADRSKRAAEPISKMPAAGSANRIPVRTSEPRRSLSPIIDTQGDLPPQTVLARVISELEADFAHYKLIYSELADQYKVLDAASDVGKRRVLADHLREVIDTLERKADQIASLYELLHFRDRPLSLSERQTRTSDARKSVHDVLRMVRETLGEEGMRRLEKDGVGFRRVPAAMAM